MATDSLTIAISADSSKLRADLAVAQAQVSQFAAQLRAAAKDSLKTGDTSGVAALAGQFDAATGRAKNLKAEMAAVNGEVLTLSQRLKEGVHGLEQAAGQFRGGAEGFLGGGLALSGAALGIAAVTAAVGELYHLASSAAEHAHEITLLSKALGVSAGQVREWTKAAAEAGVEEGLLSKYLERVVISADKASEALRKEVLEAAKIAIPDFTGGSSQPSKAQRVDPGMAPNINDPSFRAFGQQIQGDLQKANDTVVKGGGMATPLLPLDMALRKLSLQMIETGKDGDVLREKWAKFGGDAPAKSLAEALGRQDPGFQDAFTKAGAAVDDFSGKMLTADKILENVHNALKDLSAPDVLKFQRDIGGRTAIDPALTDFIKSQAAGEAFKATPSIDAGIASLDELRKQQIGIEAGAEELKLTGAAAVADFGKSFPAVTKYATDLAAELGQVDEVRFDNVTAGLKGLFDLAKAAADAVASAMSGGGADAGGGSDAGFTGPQFASGGVVRGPGTGTSDSIPAMLSHGEYVMRSAAVSRIGVGALDHLNSLRGFVRGGLVDLPQLQRFDMGGLVGAFDSIRSFARGGLVDIGRDLRSFASGGLIDFSGGDMTGSVIPHFSTGGLVPAGASGGGGQPVHLHLGGDTYELHGQPNVVAGLTAAARRSDDIRRQKTRLVRLLTWPRQTPAPRNSCTDSPHSGGSAAGSMRWPLASVTKRTRGRRPDWGSAI